MSEPRGVDSRIQWMVDHEPGEAGLCANWTWKACGGNQSPPSPPAWGTPDANAVVQKAKEAGVLFTSREAPRGAVVLYTSSTYGHMCLSKGYQYDYDIMTTDPNGNWGATGTWTQQGPIEEWGQKWAGWLIRYAGTLLPMSEPGPVYVSTLTVGSGVTEPSDSVTRLQDVLNHTSIPAPGNIDLPPTGLWGDQTTMVVNAWQKSKGYPETPYLTNEQAERLFSGWTGYDVVPADEPVPPEPEPPDPEPEPPDPVGTVVGLGIWKWYGGKPSSDMTLHPDGDWHSMGSLFAQPASGVDSVSTEWHFLYARVELPSGRSADRVVETKFVRSDGDATAYSAETFGLKKDSYPLYNMHMESGSGLGGQWWVKVSGGTDPIVLTTRYAKTHVHYLDEQEIGNAVAAGSYGIHPRRVIALIVLAYLLATAGIVIGLAK